MKKRGRPRKMKTEEPKVTPIADVVDVVEKKIPEIDELPLETYSDYKIYNKRVRLENKRAGKCIHRCKPCPIDLHPKQRVVFSRKDQPSNPQPVYLSTDMIEFRETLVPGKTYDLPLSVLSFLSGSGYPIWENVINADGSSETKKTHHDPRFSLRNVYEED